MVHGYACRGADEGQWDPEAGHGVPVEAAVQQAEHHHVDHRQDGAQHHQAGHAEHCEQVDAANCRRFFGKAPGVCLNATPCPVPDWPASQQHGQGERNQFPHVDVPVVGRW